MSARITEAAARAARLFIRNYLIERDEACGFHSDEDEWDESAREIFDGVAAALSTEPRDWTEWRAPVDFYRVLKRFAEEDGSIREGRLTTLSIALAAAPLPEDTDETHS